MTASDETPGILRLIQSTAPLRLGLLVALGCAPPAFADTVYKSVDESGVVSYSDTPPAGGETVETLVIDVEAPALFEAAQEQLQALRETTDRMVADRQQREKHRAEMRQLQMKSDPQPQIIQYGGPSGFGDPYPVYYPFPVYCDGGGCQSGPAHPDIRPPLHAQPPAGHVISPGHDYPASLIRRGYSPDVRAAFEN
jgi:hypothetical protein